MASAQKDPPAVMAFMAIFAKVKDWCDDDAGTGCLVRASRAHVNKARHSVGR